VLSLDDDRWPKLAGGYRVPIDIRPLLSKLKNESSPEVWDELWDELHHQGDVGEASYAAVPYLVAIYRERSKVDWNTYALVATIELARTQGANPGVPECFENDYRNALRELSDIGRLEIMQTTDAEASRAILSVIALDRGLRTHARFLVNYSEDELLDIESRL